MAKSATLPTYTEPSKGAAKRSDSHHRAHELVDKGDPKVNGPYLDDVRAKEEETYRKNRKKSLRAPVKKASSAAAKKVSSKSKKAPHASRQVDLLEQNREVPNDLKPLEPGDSQRPNNEAPYETKTHPEQRPLSNPSNLGETDKNLPVPKLSDIAVPSAAVAKANKPRVTEPKKPRKKSTSKKTTAKKAPVRKTSVVDKKRTVAKKTTAPKAASRKKK